MRPKGNRRPYRAPRREAAAERTRLAVVRAAKRQFERRGWAGTTLPTIAESAGVSLKTVEALFGTKSELLARVVDFSIRGDLDETPMPERPVIAEIETAPDAATMLNRHAAHLRTVNERSAAVAWVVEHAAASDAKAARLWRRMNDNRRYAVGWAVRTLMTKRGRAKTVTAATAEAFFWVAFDWGTYRTLTVHAGLSADEFERWLREYYRRAFLPSA